VHCSSTEEPSGQGCLIRQYEIVSGFAQPDVYQPIDAIVLEQFDIFSEFDHPSRTFLKFAEQYFSNGKSDPAHTATFKSCMIRIPGSHNSKCVLKNEGKTDSSTKIRIIQNWNGFRPKINLILAEFHAYLVQQKLIEIKRQKQLNKHRRNRISFECDYYGTHYNPVCDDGVLTLVEQRFC
jgi:hypothetical protein